MGNRWRPLRVALAAVAVASAAVMSAWTPASALECEGVVLDDGCLFTITGSDTPDPDDGYAVTNAHGAPFYDFIRARGLQSIGYPISHRWASEAFTFQAFQKAILQWDPGEGRMSYYNTLDALANRYPEVELPNVPPHQVIETEGDGDFASVMRAHLALLDENAAIKERFLREPDWPDLYGLPISYQEQDVDGHPQGLQLLRTQRTVFEIWNVAAPGVTVGQVNLQNIPDKVKRLDNVIIPNTAKAPRKASDPDYPALIANLSWVADGVTPLEHDAITQLERIFAASEPALRSLVQHPTDWTMRNAPHETTIREFATLALLVEQPWAKHELNLGEEDLIEIIHYGLDSLPELVVISDTDLTPATAPDPDLPAIIASLYWVADGLSPFEQRFALHLERVFPTNEPFWRTLIQKSDNTTIPLDPYQLSLAELDLLAHFAESSWAKDEISFSELTLLEVAVGHLSTVPNLASLVLQKDWLRDEVTEQELRIISDLFEIGELEREALNQANPGTDEATISYYLLQMPFLDSVEAFDVSAVSSLRKMASHDRHYLHTVVAHFAQQGGITDHHAKIVSVLGLVVESKPELLGSMLDSSRVLVEERSIVLPHTGPVTLAVIRTRPGDNNTMAYLEESVRFYEGFIRRPLPTSHIALHVSEAVDPWGGLFLGSHIAIREGYDDRSHYWNQFLRGVIHHEVSHYYWHKGPSWLGEGGANFFGIHSGATGTGAGLKDLVHECRSTSLQEVTAQRAHECRIHFGVELFYDLYHSLGEEEFLRGLWRLHDSTHGDLAADGCEGMPAGACHLRFAFGTDAPPVAGALVEGFLRGLEAWGG